NGTIELTTTGPFTFFGGTLNVANGSLTNAGTINSLVGTSGSSGNSPRVIGAQLDNQGTVNVVSRALTLRKDGPASHSTSGTITLGGADFIIDQRFGTPESFTNTGTISLGGRTLSVLGGTLNQNAGSFGGGFLAFDNATANFMTDFSTANGGLSL